MLDRLPGPTVVNRNHPLNKGRISWWLVMPSSSGGAKWIDLMGRFHATLTNMTTSASGWRGTTRPGGWGHLLFDGTDDHATVPGSQTPLRLASACSFAFWMRTTSNSVYVLSSAGGTQASWMISIGIFVVANKVHLWNGTAGVAGSTSANDGLWHRHLIAHPAGGPTAIYLDGRADTSGAGTQADMGAPTNDVYIGQRGNSSGYLSGSLDDVSIWNRALSAVEVVEDYRLSRLGHPGVLNRVGRPMAGAAVTAAGKVPWHHFFNRAV